MSSKGIEKQISDYLPQLSNKQKEAVLTVVKTFVEEPALEYNAMTDTSFVKEMDRRAAELEEGKTKGYGWEEVKKKARQSVKARKKK